MGLVDYGSSSSDSDDPERPSAKKPRLSGSRSPHHPPKSGPPSVPAPRSGSAPKPSLPPLPAAFHDLYASTVRTTTVDDPSLHQGRIRQTPHIVGNWPSHLYIEWMPPPAAFDLLSSLLAAFKSTHPVPLTSFLANDLAVPLPLHISLSRPLSLTTAQKDSFLKEIQTTIQKSNLGSFALAVQAVEWHRTPESGRSFLVLRVQSTAAAAAAENSNPELTNLLGRFNQICKSYSHPELYQWAASAPQRVASAFHISLAWSFAEPTEEITAATVKIFASQEARDKISREISIPVESIKAKIGNVVTNIPLSAASTSKRKLVNILGL